MNTVNGVPFPLKPENSAKENFEALQSALDKCGKIEINDEGTYNIDQTFIIKSNTEIIFGKNVIINRVGDKGDYVFVNEGAFNRTWNENIKIKGMTLQTNGFGPTPFACHSIIGLTAQVCFHCVENLVIEDFICMDVPADTYCIQICGFKYIRVSNAHIEGLKDGVHLGAGTDFIIENCVFRTFDDPIALNPKDYSTCQPVMDWLDRGQIINCIELDQSQTTGYFARLTGGAWVDWYKGFQVQNSDMAVSNGRVYIVISPCDGTKQISVERPCHKSGTKIYPDGVKWRMLQEGELYSCGCKNILFKDIIMDKNRQVGFALTHGRDNFERSCIPGCNPGEYGEITFENVKNTKTMEYFLWTITLCKKLVFKDCKISSCRVHLAVLDEIWDKYTPTEVVFENCTFIGNGEQVILSNDPRRKVNVSFSNTKFEGEIIPKLEGKFNIISSDFKAEYI